MPRETLPPYWADAYEHIKGHVFRRRDNGALCLSAEKTWQHLRENLARTAKA